eukprot:TRINITY_DN5083_c0_g1_i2.p1 TRINITY_DN5083_c0_g1~~TRINITY_DN5083_c0_g1_i2.p1  ORF type:complete len:169 (+),score=28.62 TRINITY_DN5083_c0_g1_i2:59-508(+)
MEAEKGSGVESGADPREAQYVAQILEAMGVDDYEPQVVRQLMEFSHRYITGVLRDAQSYMEYAGHTELHLEDVKLAIQSRVNYSFTTPPQVSFLKDLSQLRNEAPLSQPSDPPQSIHLPKTSGATRDTSASDSALITPHFQVFPPDPSS